MTKTMKYVKHILFFKLFNSLDCGYVQDVKNNNSNKKSLNDAWMVCQNRADMSFGMKNAILDETGPRIASIMVTLNSCSMQAFVKVD